MNEIKIPLKELRRALTQVAQFAGQDSYLPMLSIIEWRSDGKTITLTATDRYTAGRAKVALAEPGEPFDAFTMKLTDARRLLAIFKASKLIPSVTMNPGQKWKIFDDTVTLQGTAFDGQPATSMMDKIFRDAVAAAKKVEPAAASPEAFNASLLTRIRTAESTQGTPAIFWPSAPNKPKLVTAGDWFYAIMMPVRLPGTDGQQVLDLIQSECAEKLDSAPASTVKKRAPRKAKTPAAA